MPFPDILKKLFSLILLSNRIKIKGVQRNDDLASTDGIKDMKGLILFASTKTQYMATKAYGVQLKRKQHIIIRFLIVIFF